MSRWRDHRIALAVFVAGALLVVFDLGRWLDWRLAQPSGYYPRRADWSASYRGALGFSCYVFRDRNRNGVYDLGDLPMASVVVEMTAAGGKPTVERSNLSGFANFPMSVAKRSASIRAPGEYDFRVVVPPGWVVTSGNASQSTEFEALPGAPADLVAKNPTSPVGLAPELVISGRLVTRDAVRGLLPAAHTPLAVVGPAGERRAAAVGEDGAFSIPAAPGRWRLIAGEPATKAPVERAVTVRDAPVRLAAIVLGEAVPAPLAPPVTVDFESVTGAPVAKVPSGVAGLDWNYLNAIDAVSGGGAGYVNTLASGRYVGYGSSGHPVTVSRTGAFDFYGAYFGVGLPQAEGETLRIQAWRGGVAVGDEEVTLSALGPVWFDADFRSIDRLRLATRHYWHLVTDDMQFGVPRPAPAEPR